MNKTAFIGGAVVATVAGASAVVYGARSLNSQPYGEVISTTPVYENVTVAEAPQQECHQEKVVTREKWGTNSVAGTLIGGAAGGLLGNQFGHGSGKTAATAVGAIGGAYAGNRIANSQYPDQQVSYRQKCTTVTPTHVEQKLSAYDVSYRYKGKVYTARMDHDPGARVDLQMPAPQPVPVAATQPR